VYNVPGIALIIIPDKYCAAAQLGAIQIGFVNYQDVLQVFHHERSAVWLLGRHRNGVGIVRSESGKKVTHDTASVLLVFRAVLGIKPDILFGWVERSGRPHDPAAFMAAQIQKRDTVFNS
jgi:hypothetical protein